MRQKETAFLKILDYSMSSKLIKLGLDDISDLQSHSYLNSLPWILVDLSKSFPVEEAFQWLNSEKECNMPVDGLV